MSDPNIRPHAAHAGKNNATSATGLAVENLPSKQLHSESAYVCALLEELDDVIFAAVRGSEPALEQARTLWPRVVEAIGWELVEESREQYLRFAIDVRQRFEFEEPSKPEHAIAALEIISLLTH